MVLSPLSPLTAALLVLAPALALATPEPPPVWAPEFFDHPPAAFPAADFVSPHCKVRALFFAGPPYQGRPTRVFAWVGLPAVSPGQTVPGIVLIHGGLGTAFDEWVKLWVDRGYAAIAMDTCGALPEPRDASPRPRHEHSGPAGWGGFQEITEPVADQWAYHAVGVARLAHSLLRAQPGVDPARIGVTGISWGGYLACLLAATDPRVAFAVPVYGCGFLNETVFGARLRESAPDQGARWLDLWDPSRHLPAVSCPMLWINGTNDRFFFPEPWQKSHRLIAPSLRTLTLLPDLAHGQEQGAAIAEIVAFADCIVRDGEPLPLILGDSCDGSTVHVRFKSLRPLKKAELIYTADTTGPWPQRRWESVPATLSTNTVTVTLPANARLYFVNLTDARGLVVSTEYHSTL